MSEGCDDDQIADRSWQGVKIPQGGCYWKVESDLSHIFFSSCCSHCTSQPRLGHMVKGWQNPYHWRTYCSMERPLAGNKWMQESYVRPYYGSVGREAVAGTLFFVIRSWLPLFHGNLSVNVSPQAWCHSESVQILGTHGSGSCTDMVPVDVCIVDTSQEWLCG